MCIEDGYKNKNKSRIYNSYIAILLRGLIRNNRRNSCDTGAFVSQKILRNRVHTLRRELNGTRSILREYRIAFSDRTADVPWSIYKDQLRAANTSYDTRIEYGGDGSVSIY